MTIPNSVVLTLFDSNGIAQDVSVPLTWRYSWEPSFTWKSFVADVQKLDIVQGECMNFIVLQTLFGQRHKHEPYMEADDYCEHYLEVFALVDWNEDDTKNPICCEIEGPFFVGVRVVYLDRDTVLETEAYVDIGSVLDSDTLLDFLQKWAALKRAKRVAYQEYLEDDEDEDDDLAIYNLKIIPFDVWCNYESAFHTEWEAFNQIRVLDDRLEEALAVVLPDPNL
jgi:hypothetical protein